MFAHLYSGHRPLHSTNCTSSKQRYFYKLHSLQFKNFQSPSILTYSRCVDTVWHKVRASADLFCKNQQTAKSQNWHLISIGHFLGGQRRSTSKDINNTCYNNLIIDNLYKAELIFEKCTQNRRCCLWYQDPIGPPDPPNKSDSQDPSNPLDPQDPPASFL